MVVITRAGRFREWSQGELRLYFPLKIHSVFFEFSLTLSCRRRRSVLVLKVPNNH